MPENTREGTMEPRDETLIFLHVPKTAGVSMSRTIIRHFAEDEIFHVRSPAHERAPVFSKDHGTVDDFRQLPESQRGRYRLILGHMHFGLHEHVPRPCAYVTVLRDPVERLLSHYGQFRRMVENNELADGQGFSTFEGFCKAKWNAADNHQTRFVCGEEFDKHSRRENLERAKENLRKHFRVVGTMERFDETVRVLHRVRGWPDVAQFRDNVGGGRLQREAIDEEFLAYLEALNCLDRDLHALADSLLDAAIARCRTALPPADAPRRAPRRPFFLRRVLQHVLRRP